MKDDEAVWTISLNENFKVDSAASTPPSGNISLYKATMKENKPITLQFKTSNTFNTVGEKLSRLTNHLFKEDAIETSSF